MATPAIIQEANKRAKARHRDPHEYEEICTRLTQAPPSNRGA